MGRSYWFDCSRCGYRAKVSGRADRGLDFFVQTILCEECKQLYDAVTRLRFPQQNGLALHRAGMWTRSKAARTPPTFLAALNRLPHKSTRHFRWLNFSLQCPVSAIHRVRTWNEPDKCPHCGTLLERTVLPYRLWE